MSFDEGLEFIGAHALRANVGRCDLYILRHELGNHAHELEGMRQGRRHQRWLAESLPRIAEITEEILGKFVASSRRAPFGIAGLAKTALLG